MARTVDITLVPETLELEAGSGAKQVVFTATYKQTGTFETLVRVVTDRPEATAWIRLDGAKERTFQENATVQIVATVEIPAGASSGDYTFRVAVVGVENTDEDYTESPRVRLAVKKRPEVKPFPWWIVAVIAGVVIAGGLVLYLVLRTDKAGLAEVCSPKVVCDAKLTCTEGKCLGEAGFKGCAIDANCASGPCKDGVCTDKPGAAAVNQPCTAEPGCKEKLVCTGGFCKGATSFTCAADEDCVSNVCDDKRCTTLGNKCDRGCDDTLDVCTAIADDRICLRKNSAPCETSYECSSQHCDAGSGKCEAKAGCNSNDDCGRGQTCENGQCFVLAGQACNNLKGTACKFGFCRAGHCPKLGCDEAGCPADFACRPNGRCLPTKLFQADFKKAIRSLSVHF